jgi:hypothetical protein
LGSDPQEKETIVRTHALMGQIYFFAMSRAAILRRLEWKTLAGKNALQVVRVVEQNLNVLAAGWAEASKEKERSGRES